MFTTGIDFGNEYCVVGVARKGGIDVVANEASYRKTPNLVTFTPEQRFIGQSAHSQKARNVKTTVTNIKRLIGRQYDEEDVQKELPFLSYKVIRQEDGSIGIPMQVSGEEKVLNPTQIAAAMLGQLKRQTEKETAHQVRDVVIGVPGWWTDQQRRALLDAARIAGLNPLQVLNELTSVALELGLRKDRELSKDQTETVMFFDMGHSQTQCAVMRYSKGKLEVLGYGYNHHLGGRNITKRLVEHFRNEWLEKYKFDIFTHGRAQTRTWDACQKLKHVLSANTKAHINLECLMNDKDVSSSLTREAFIPMVADLLDNVLAPVRDALTSAGLTKEEVQSVEVVGDSHRIPAVLEQLTAFFGKAPGKRTNATEVVAKGAAWQCARRSPVFRVVPYELKDLLSYPVEFEWSWSTPQSEDTKGTTSAVFQANSSLPVFKQVTFKKTPVEGHMFTAKATYAEGVALPPGASRQLGTWKVGPIPVLPAASTTEKAAIKIGCKLDESGCVLISRAEEDWTEEVEYQATEEVPLTAEETAAAEEAAKAEAEAKAAEAAKAPEATEGAAEDAKEAPKETDKKEPEPAKQPQTKKVKVTKRKKVDKSKKLAVVEDSASLSKTALEAWRELELQMYTHDRLVIETAAERNKVESYVYEVRDKLSYAWADFEEEEKRDSFRALLTATEDWLYDEGEGQTKSVYAAKLAELKKIGDPIERRYRQSEDRPEASANLHKALNEWKAWVDTQDERFAHITSEQREVVRSKCAEIEQWLTSNMELQDTMKKTQDPVILVADIQNKRAELQQVCMPIHNTPKPKPKPVEKPKEEAKTDAKADADTPPPAEEDPTATDASDKKEEQATPEAQPMDTSN